MNQETRQLQSVLRWALESAADASMAAADWLAQDIDPTQPSAIVLLTRPDVPLAQLEQAKQAYKTMRLLGESVTDRRVGGTLYLAAIAAALVYHDALITRQSSRALLRALRAMRDDHRHPQPLLDLAARAVEVLQTMDSKTLRFSSSEDAPESPSARSSSP